MNAISSNSWDLNRNLWIFIRNAIVQHHRVNPLPQGSFSAGNINVPQKVWEPAQPYGGNGAAEGHIDFQA